MAWKSGWRTGPGICQTGAQRRKEGEDAGPAGPLNQESESESARKAARFYSTLSWNRGRLLSYLSLSPSRNVFSFLRYWPKSSYGPDTGWALKYLFNKWKNEEEPALELGYFIASRSSQREAVGIAQPCRCLTAGNLTLSWIDHMDIIGITLDGVV